MFGNLFNLSNLINVSGKGRTICNDGGRSTVTVTVNGKTITIEGNHKNVSVINGIIYVDGKPYEESDSEKKESGFEKYEVVKVVVNGNVGTVNGTSIEINGGVSGDVDGTNITVSGDVGGDIDGTNVSVGGSVNGGIDATFVS